MSDSAATPHKRSSFFFRDRPSTESPDDSEARLRHDRPFFNFLAIMGGLMGGIICVLGMCTIRSDQSLDFWLWSVTVAGMSLYSSTCGTIAAMITRMLSMSAEIEALKLALEAKSISEKADRTN